MENGILGCFGKLPIHSDFIRFRASGEELRALDQWFQEGIHAVRSRWGKEWEADFSKGDAWNFVFRPRGAEGFLIGIFIPSQDQSGRRYPFFLFLRGDCRRFGAPLRFAPGAYAPCLAELEGLARAGWAGKTVKGYLEMVEQWRGPEFPPPPSEQERYRAFLQEEASSAFWMALLGEFEHPRKYRVDQNVSALLEPLRLHPSVPFGWGLKFPLAAQGRESGSDLPFWFDWVSRVLKREPDDSFFFWSRSGAAGPCLLAFIGPPSPKAFAFFLRPERDGESWYDLAPPQGDDLAALREKARPERRAVLEAGGLRLSELLERIGAMV